MRCQGTFSPRHFNTHIVDTFVIPFFFDNTQKFALSAVWCPIVGLVPSFLSLTVIFSRFGISVFDPFFYVLVIPYLLATFGCPIASISRHLDNW